MDPAKSLPLPLSLVFPFGIIFDLSSTPLFRDLEDPFCVLNWRLETITCRVKNMVKTELRGLNVDLEIWNPIIICVNLN